jgi:hypothetical protein
MEKSKKKQEDTTTSDEIYQFLTITASTDKALARRYLEMSGQNVEMAVTLFLESGGGFGFGGAGPAAAAEKKNAVVEEEPDFYSMSFAQDPPPLLPAGKIVTSALREYWAFRTLRRVLLRWIQGRKVSTTARPIVISRGLNSNHYHQGTSHFLMQSLIHPRINVRRAAGRMFLHNLHQIQDLDKKIAIMGMQESLIVLLHNVMFGEAPYESKLPPRGVTSLSRSPIHQQANEGDPAIQLMGMLTCLVCNGGFSTVLIADHIKTLEDGFKGSTDILLNYQLQELASFSIESFVASGGLRWACGSILRLVHLLVHGPLTEEEDGSGSDSDSHYRRKRRSKNAGITNETIQTRLVLLVDLVYRLVLFGSVPFAVDRQGVMALIHSSDNNGDDNSKNNSNEEAQKKKKRNHLSQFYDIMSRATRDTGGETSRTMALRSSVRNSLASSRSLMSPPLPSGDKYKSGGGDGGDKERQVSAEVAEENRLRRERRKATLERVHSVFWKTTLPAAMCVGDPSRMNDDAMDTNLGKNHDRYYGTFRPLACLIAAYEILRSPSTRFDDDTNRAIGILSRLIDPSAGCCLVVSEPEIPWGLASLLGDLGESKGADMADEIRSKKRDRSASQESQRSKSSAARPNAASASHDESGHRSKRQRTRRTHMTSLLERLADPSRDTGDNLTSASPYSAAGASASTHYSSLLRGMGAAGSSALSSANRDGSLSRIIAAAEERSGLSEIRARAVLDQSPGAAAGDWRLIDAIAETAGDNDEQVYMMDEDDDNDTEFEQDQEDAQGDGIEDNMPDEQDDEGDAFCCFCCIRCDFHPLIPPI